jgi:predicted dehydrogenase
MNRREFLAAAGAISLPYVVPCRVVGAVGKPGANDRIRLGFIGVGNRGRWLISTQEFPGADIVAVADCFLPRCYEVAKLREAGEKWTKYQDYRKMLEKEKLDAVFVETTTHARALVCIHAMQAGLDVYAEKPISLTVAEGRMLVNAVRKYDRILQTGTQQRSIPSNIYASRLVREGALGKVHTVIVCNFEGPRRWAPNPAEPMPDGLDWDQWCNQTELRPYRKELHIGWETWWDYDGGGRSWGVTGWGTHSLDQVQCALGTDETGPVEIWPEEFGPQCRISMRYAGGTILRLEDPIRKDPARSQLGAIFVGDEGMIEIKRGSYTAEPQELLKGAPGAPPEGPEGEKMFDAYHIQNFLDCIRARKEPNADVEIGHRSTTVCHLANICREVGRKLRWDPVTERFTGDDEASALLSRQRRKGYELPNV